MLNTEASQGHHKSLLVREATAQENKYRIGFPLNVNNVKQNTQENYLFNSVCVCVSIYIYYSQEKKDQLFVQGSRAGCQELQIWSIVYLKTREQQLSDSIGKHCAQPSLFQRLMTLKHTFYRAAAENQSKIRQCGDSGVQSIALSSNCSGEVQSGSPLLGSAKLLPVETRGRLAWKHQIHFVHIHGFCFSELQMDFHILASHATAV